MKKLILSLMLLHLFELTHAQTNPTLAVGLETLTMNKGTIDVEVLTKIIMEKQKELKGEALKRFMFKMFPQSNYTTKFYIQNCLNVLLNEKNPQVIEKEVLELTTNYALALGVAYAFVEIDGDEIRNANSAYLEYTLSTENPDLVKADDYITLIHKVRGDRFLWTFFQRNLLRKEIRKFRIQDKLDLILKDGSQPKNMFSLANNRREIKAKSRRIKNKEIIIFKIKQHREVTAEDSIYQMLKDASKSVHRNAYGLSNEKKIKRHFRKLRFDKLRDDLGYKESKNNEQLRLKINELVAIERDLLPIVSKILKKEQKVSFKVTDTINKSEDELSKVINKMIENNNTLLESIKNMKFDNEILKKITSLSNSNKIIKQNYNIYSQIKKIETFNKIPIDDKLNKTNLKLEIPFGNVLDVVSLSLSDMETLRKKGFFKNKIDYRTDDFYLSLVELKAGRIYRDSLNNLKNSICKKINPYIEHYDVIKEFIYNAKIKDKDSIIKTLKKNASDLIKGSLKIEENNSYVQIQLKEISDKNEFLNKVQEISQEKEALSEIVIAEINYSSLTSIQLQIQLLDNLFQKINENKLITNIYKNRGVVEPLKQVKFNINDFFDLQKNDTISSDTNLAEINMTIHSINNIIEDNKRDSFIRAEEINKLYENSPHSSQIIYPIVKKNDFDKLLKKLNDEIAKKKIEYKNLTNTNTKIVAKEIETNYNNIIENGDFYKRNLQSVLKVTSDSYNINNSNIDSITVSKAAKLFAKIYSKFDNIIKTDTVSLADIRYIENDVSNILIELKARDTFGPNDTTYTSILNKINVIVPLLKIKALQGVDLGTYNEELMTLFEFIANLDKLDKAETFTSIIDMMRTGSKKVEDNLKDGKFKDEYTIFTNAVKKYTLVNTTENYVEVDVASFLSDLQTHFSRNDTSVLSLYLSIGLNENVFLKKNFVMPGVNGYTINNIGFASEKLGVKVRLHSFKKYGGYQNVIKDDVYLNKKAPFINDLYTVVYGSGLLYSLANTATDTNFDFAHVGAGIGLRFYNALDVNFTIGFPFVKNSHFGDNAFLGLGLDIPLGEYLEKLGK